MCLTLVQIHPAHGASAYDYNADNLLVSAGSSTLGYDPLGRLAQTVGAGVTTRFAYDGADLIAEYSGSCSPSPSAGAGGCNTLLRRYVHGPGSDEPLVWYEGASTACLPSPPAGGSGCDRRFLKRDGRRHGRAGRAAKRGGVNSPLAYTAKAAS